MTFKEKLVILRKTRGITQDEFASAVGVSRQAVYKWECGQSYPEVPKLLEIKLLFGKSDFKALVKKIVNRNAEKELKLKKLSYLGIRLSAFPLVNRLS
jgi:transcriptional regulator with XRE-family HTH domain